MNKQRQLGQYFTTVNPFDSPLFDQWWQLIPNVEKETLLEPFAGANHIPKNIIATGRNNLWDCFDIDDSHNSVVENIKVVKCNTLKKFPKKYNVCITNPPYLAKNSATRRGLKYEGGAFDDLYQYSLKVILDNVSFCAAIIPESFMNQNLFNDRIWGIVSLKGKYFEQTEHPVCLALFVPKSMARENYEIYSNQNFLISKNKASQWLPKTEKKNEWVFNDPKGTIGLIAIDNQKSASIRWVLGSEITNNIKGSSRSVTKIGGYNLKLPLSDFIILLNQYFNQFRLNTHDTLLTAFKGMRDDGSYRRRLDFHLARQLMDYIYWQQWRIENPAKENNN